MKTIGIVVTYNRNKLLERCLKSISEQSVRLSNILIIDNASTDGTQEWFEKSIYSQDTSVIYLRLPINSGGAGGFSAGLDFFEKQGYDWAWIMDDDAEPEPNAFEQLLLQPLDHDTIYGSIAISGEYTAWKTTLLTDIGPTETNLANTIPDLCEVSFLPFLGLLIHRNTVLRIGLPDSGFFIAGDDLEYCLRAKKANFKIMVVGKSKIHHPRADIQTRQILGVKIDVLKIPPWKNFYNTRNKIIIAKNYHGYKLYTETLPGIFLRLIINLLFDKRKLSNVYAAFAGIFDGLFENKGMRHIFWRIKQ